MSSRRHLVSRTQRTDETPSRQSRRSEQPDASSTRATDLPPYEAPAYPLTMTYQRKLADTSSSRDYSRYKRHLETAIKNVTNCAAESNDRLYDAKHGLEKQVQKREANATGDDNVAEKIEAELLAEQRVASLEDKVSKLTEEAEKALRDLIDYRDEMAQQEDMLKTVCDEAISLAVPSVKRREGAGGRRNRRAQRDQDDDDSGVEDLGADASYEPDQMDVDAEEAASALANALSPTELLRNAKATYLATYNSRSKRARYAEHNDYKSFKQVVHDAQHPGPNAPPVPHARTWFPDEADGPSNTPASRRRRRATAATDNTGNGDDEDDDIQFAGAISDLKCPLTLQTYKEPYTNRICKHTFEKSAIIAFHDENAASLPDPSQGRRGRHHVPHGPKVMRCPQHGCENMLELKDFYDDQIILRQVKRAAAQAAAEMEEDEDEDEAEEEDHDVGDEDITAFAD